MRNKTKGLVKSCAIWYKPTIYLGFILMLTALFISAIFRDFDFSFNLMVFGLGVLTLGFAFFTVKLADESDKKMIAISNMNFLEALSDFEITRMKAIGNLPKYIQQRNNELRRNMVGTYISRSLSECERIAELNKDHIKIRHEQKFVNLFCASMEVLYTDNYYNIGWNDLPEEQQSQIIMMHSIIRRYERLPTEEERLVSIRESFMGQESNESESDFYNRMIQDYNLENYPYS